MKNCVINSYKVIHYKMLGMLLLIDILSKHENRQLLSGKLDVFIRKIYRKLDKIFPNFQHNLLEAFDLTNIITCKLCNKCDPHPTHPHPPPHPENINDNDNMQTNLLCLPFHFILQ